MKQVSPLRFVIHASLRMNYGTINISIRERRKKKIF